MSAARNGTKRSKGRSPGRPNFGLDLELDSEESLERQQQPSPDQVNLNEQSSSVESSSIITLIPAGLTAQNQTETEALLKPGQIQVLYQRPEEESIIQGLSLSN